MAYQKLSARPFRLLLPPDRPFPPEPMDVRNPKCQHSEMAGRPTGSKHKDPSSRALGPQCHSY